jgi:hypothetical protein
MANFISYYFGEDYKMQYDIGSSLRNEYARYLISQWFEEAKRKRDFDLDPKDLQRMVELVRQKHKLGEEEIENIAEELKLIAQDIIKSAEQVA